MAEESKRVEGSIPEREFSLAVAVEVEGWETEGSLLEGRYHQNLTLRVFNLWVNVKLSTLDGTSPALTIMGTRAFGSGLDSRTLMGFPLASGIQSSKTRSSTSESSVQHFDLQAVEHLEPFSAFANALLGSALDPLEREIAGIALDSLLLAWEQEVINAAAVEETDVSSVILDQSMRLAREANYLLTPLWLEALQRAKDASRGMTNE